MKTRIRAIIFITLFILSSPSPVMCDVSKSHAPIVRLQDFTYHAGNRDSLEVIRAITAFEARKKAVYAAAEILVQKGLLKHYGKKQAEIFSLTANIIAAQTIFETYAEKEKTNSIRIKAEVNLSDFMEAEIQNQALEKGESDLLWKEEMEQHVSKQIDPGRELSRAYRYIRKGQTRIAIIYLDHLVKKYAHWGEVYYVRAIGFQRMHNSDQTIENLEKACSLSNQDACSALNAIK